MVPSASVDVIRVAGGNMFISATEDEVWTGTLAGTGLGAFTLVVHRAGFETVKGESLLAVTVAGKTGTLEIGWAGNNKNDLGVWWFHWTILRGTGELENLRGQGTGFGPGPAGLDIVGCADLSGKIVFAPD